MPPGASVNDPRRARTDSLHRGGHARRGTERLPKGKLRAHTQLRQRHCIASSNAMVCKSSATMISTSAKTSSNARCVCGSSRPSVAA